jgi:hypothetical protein
MSTNYLSPHDLQLCQAVLNQITDDSPIVDSRLRAEIAARILARANSGEKDPERLKAYATEWIALVPPYYRGSQ